MQLKCIDENCCQIDIKITAYHFLSSKNVTFVYHYIVIILLFDAKNRLHGRHYNDLYRPSSSITMMVITFFYNPPSPNHLKVVMYFFSIIVKNNKKGIHEYILCGNKRLYF